MLLPTMVEEFTDTYALSVNRQVINYSRTLIVVNDINS